MPFGLMACALFLAPSAQLEGEWRLEETWMNYFFKLPLRKDDGAFIVRDGKLYRKDGGQEKPDGIPLKVSDRAIDLDDAQSGKKLQMLYRRTDDELRVWVSLPVTNGDKQTTVPIMMLFKKVKPSS